MHSIWKLCSLTRDWTHASCIGSTESEPLDCQGSPKDECFLNRLMWLALTITGLPIHVPSKLPTVERKRLKPRERKWPLLWGAPESPTWLRLWRLIVDQRLPSCWVWILFPSRILWPRRCEQQEIARKGQNEEKIEESLSDWKGHSLPGWPPSFLPSSKTPQTRPESL